MFCTEYHHSSQPAQNPSLHLFLLLPFSCLILSLHHTTKRRAKLLQGACQRCVLDAAVLTHGSSSLVSARLATRVNAAGSHWEGLTEHLWKPMERLLFNAINRLWVWCLTPASAHPGVGRSLAPDLNRSRGMARDVGRSCGRKSHSTG